MVYQHTGSNRYTYEMLRTLGGFTFTTNDKGETIITDTYDFNDADGMFSKGNWAKVWKYADSGDKYGLVRAGMSIFGSSEGEGRGIVINLGVISDKKTFMRHGGKVQRQKFWQGGNPHAGGYKSLSLIHI